MWKIARIFINVRWKFVDIILFPCCAITNWFLDLLNNTINLIFKSRIGRSCIIDFPDIIVFFFRFLQYSWTHSSLHFSALFNERSAKILDLLYCNTKTRLGDGDFRQFSNRLIDKSTIMPKFGICHILFPKFKWTNEVTYEVGCFKLGLLITTSLILITVLFTV